MGDASNVLGILARVFVEDIDRALPTYEGLTGDTTPRRFRFRDVELAWVGPFLLLDVPAEQRAGYERAATILVRDMAAAQAAVLAGGGVLVESPEHGPNGLRMIARHGDGAVFEYIQPDPPG